MNFNKSYQHIIPLTLAFLMLMTSVSFAVDMHYCNGELKSVSLFGKAKTCHEKAVEQDQPTCPHHQKMMEKDEKKDCCENKTTIVQADDDLAKSDISVLNTPQFQQFVIAYVTVFYTKITTDKQSIQDISYQSPLISRDIYALSETFLL